MQPAPCRDVAGAVTTAAGRQPNPGRTQPGRPPPEGSCRVARDPSGTLGPSLSSANCGNWADLFSASSQAPLSASPRGGPSLARMPITQIHLARRYRRATAGLAVVAVGGLLAGCGSSGSTAATSTTNTGANAGATATPTAPSGTRQLPPGFGKVVTGSAASKAEAAALAKYPGTVERVMQLDDGSYVVHVLRSSGEVHVEVSKAFAVTGTEQGMPGGGAPPATAGTTTPS
jgi:hypothetical protein